jgi:uncharacterized membrane protein
MKVINEKGKLFGIINIVDLLVLLFILLVIGGVAWKIFGSQVTGLVASTKEITYTVLVENVSPQNYDELAKRPFPQQLSAGDALIKDANLVSAESVPHSEPVTTADGKIVTATDNDKVDIICTVKATISNTDILKVGPQEIRVGKSYIMKTRFFEVLGTIESITLEGEK